MTPAREYQRCPTCAGRGTPIQYGMPAGPPGPGVVLGGCIVSADNPDFLCRACHTSWRLLPDGGALIVDAGSTGMMPKAQY